MIAIKFDSNGEYISHCIDNLVTDLNDICPSSEGYAFYDIGELDLADARYFKLQNGVVALDTEVKRADTAKAAARIELAEFENWFTVYDRKIAEHSRCIRLGQPCHHNIAELDSEAMQKQLRIRELRAGL